MEAWKRPPTPLPHRRRHGSNADPSRASG
jgi:hypothetical protein